MRPLAGTTLALAAALAAPVAGAWSVMPQPTSGMSVENTDALPDYAAVRADWRPSDVRLLASDGKVLQRTRTNFAEMRGDWIPLSHISAALQGAVVQSEDHRFYEHDGVDWLATASAAWSLITGEGHRGASTISMQLAAMLDPRLMRHAGGRGILQKFKQMRAAEELESRWTKPQILEAYLNLAAYRGELVGVDALSRVLFRKRASGLTLREGALAAVLIRSPNASVSTLTRRSCRLERKLDRPYDCAGMRDFIEAALANSHEAPFDEGTLAPHRARLLLDQGAKPDPQGNLRSSLIAGLQAAAVRSVHQHLSDLQGTGVTDAAVVVLDNRTGAVLAYVGSSAGLSNAASVDHARALRQAGSTLKPFLYALALQQERLTAASLLDDRPVDLDGGSGLYVPDNYDHHFSGWVSARTALASSLNVPAVRTLMLVGPDVLARELVALGLPLQHTGDYYGYSLALGSADVTLLSLTNAYRALARGGNYAPVNMLASPDAPAQRGVQVYSPQAAWIVGDMLGDPDARARTFGLDSPLATRFWTAVKTGTSRDMRDNWCVGWSADYTVGVWVGNSAGASMRNVSGVSGAGPIWHDMFAWLYRHRPAREPARPAGVVARAVHFTGGLEPQRTEYFLGDTAQSTFAPPAPDAAPGGVRIAGPVDGTILALDPDIPPIHQRLPLRAVDARLQKVTAVRWYVDGRLLGEGDALTWAPVPGRHEFEIRDGAGHVLDRSELLVRGLPQG